jgi:hypothetical protein
MVPDTNKPYLHKPVTSRHGNIPVRFQIKDFHEGRWTRAIHAPAPIVRAAQRKEMPARENGMRNRKQHNAIPDEMDHC